MSKNAKKIWSNFECLKRAPEALEHGIDVEKWFLDRFSAKKRMSKISKILVKIFECLKRASVASRTWDRCKKCF